jgi:hypothetical protein
MYQRVIGTCPVSPAVAILSFESKARILLYQMGSSLPRRAREDTGLTVEDLEVVAGKVERQLSGACEIPRDPLITANYQGPNWAPNSKDAQFVSGQNDLRPQHNYHNRTSQSTTTPQSRSQLINVGQGRWGLRWGRPSQRLFWGINSGKYPIWASVAQLGPPIHPGNVAGQ